MTGTNHYRHVDIGIACTQATGFYTVILLDFYCNGVRSKRGTPTEQLFNGGATYLTRGMGMGNGSGRTPTEGKAHDWDT